jgi:hypothetical protein
MKFIYRFPQLCSNANAYSLPRRRLLFIIVLAMILVKLPMAFGDNWEFDDLRYVFKGTARRAPAAR